MSTPILIDSLSFARDRQSRSGRIALAKLARVVEELAATDGELVWSLQGDIDTLSRPFLRLQIQTKLTLRCQRCLETMPFSLDVDSRITLFTSEARLESACEMDESLDAIVATEELNIEALIEDEVLLALPIAPRHENCGNAALERSRAERPNPFAVLASLKRQPE